MSNGGYGQAAKCSLRDMSCDYNGNHVVQKLLGRIEELRGKQVYDSFFQLIQQDIVIYCKHEYCCRIIQRLIESCHQDTVHNLVNMMLQNFELLIKNQYGTFVLCCIIDRGSPQHKLALVRKVYPNMSLMSTDRDGSKVVENCFKMFANMKSKKNAKDDVNQ